MNICSVVLIFILSFFTGPAATYTASGKASFYADHMHGQRTASGERYDKKLFTAAHATLPFDTRVRVTNLKNGRSVIVKINDRMTRNRYKLIDVSKAAAVELDMVRDGMVEVQLTEVKATQPTQQEMPVTVSEAVTNSSR